MGLSGIFVVGTDTGVGKTRLASAIARCLVEQGRAVGVLKPIATGAAREGDSWHCDDGECLIRAVGGGLSLDGVVPIIFEEPLAPCVAARRLGRPLEPAEVKRVVADALTWWADRAELVVVEGIGGLLTPITDGEPCWTVADLAITLDFPLLVVARRGLGTLNQTLLTVEAATRRGLRVAGVVLNSPEPARSSLAEATNADALARLLDRIPILAELEHEHETNPDPVPVAVRDVDWYDRFGQPRVLANR